MGEASSSSGTWARLLLDPDPATSSSLGRSPEGFPPSPMRTLSGARGASELLGPAPLGLVKLLPAALGCAALEPGAPKYCAKAMGFLACCASPLSRSAIAAFPSAVRKAMSRAAGVDLRLLLLGELNWLGTRPACLVTWTAGIALLPTGPCFREKDVGVSGRARLLKLEPESSGCLRAATDPFKRKAERSPSRPPAPWEEEWREEGDPFPSEGEAGASSSSLLKSLSLNLRA